MSNKVDKADAIKNHAINGRFTEIETEFGAKAALKGKEYVSYFARIMVLNLYLTSVL